MPENEDGTRTAIDGADNWNASSTTFCLSAQFCVSSGTAQIPHCLPPKIQQASAPPPTGAGHPVTKVPAPASSAASAPAVPAPPPEIKPSLTGNYVLVLLMGALITSFGNWVSKTIPSPQDPPPPAVPAKVKFGKQVLQNPPDGKPLVVTIFGDPKQVANNVKFCVEAFPEVEWLGVPAYDNSQVEINNVMHVERERVALTADCFKIGRLDKDQTLTIPYPAKIKQSPARHSPTLVCIFGQEA